MILTIAIILGVNTLTVLVALVVNVKSNKRYSRTVESRQHQTDMIETLTKAIQDLTDSMIMRP